MRGVAFQTRFRWGVRPIALTMTLLGVTLSSAVAAEPYYDDSGRSTVEVSIPKSARRPPTTRSNSSSVARTTRYEPVREPVASSGRRASVATRSSSPNGNRQVAAYEDSMPSSGVTRYPNARTAMHRSSNRMRAPAMEEVMQGDMVGEGMEGEVIYDDYMDEGSMPGHGYHGGYHDGYPGGHPGWDGGNPYLPDVWRSKTWGITAGAEALWIRPHFSQSMGLQAITGTQPGATSLVQINGINWNNDYVGAFRGYLGIRDLVCGDELRFSYWNFGDNQQLSAIADETTNYCDFLCNMTANPGDVVNTSLNLQVNVFDLDLIRAFCLPQACQPVCDSCDSCGGGDSCDSCGSCGPCCPIWDVRWFAGLRFAQIDRSLYSSITTSEGLTAVNADSTANFSGLGPRIGLQMRRYFDHAARWSIYGRGAGSLLVGNLEQQINNFNVTSPPTLITSNDTFNRLIPVAEIEIGGSWCVTQRITLSGGWMAQAWWDLGIQERVTDFDTSNILGFDGFFVRGEIVF